MKVIKHYTREYLECINEKAVIKHDFLIDGVVLIITVALIYLWIH